MKLEVHSPNLGDSLTYKTENIKNEEYEREMINNIILLLSGYQSKMFETYVSEKEGYELGIFPKIIRICPEVKINHPSKEAIKSLLNQIANFGSSIHLMCKLNDALENSYRDPKNQQNKKLPHSLITLISEYKNDGNEVDNQKYYDWNWKEDLGGLTKAIKIIVQDWRFIMFSIQNKIVKNKSESENKSEISIKPPSYEEEIKSPIIEIFEKSEEDWSEEIGILDIYTKIEPYVKVIENMANIMETFLNYIQIKKVSKKEMPNIILIIFILKIRYSEMNNEEELVNLWRYMIYHTFKDKKDYLLNIKSEKMFKGFEEPIKMIKEVSESISELDPENKLKDLKMLQDEDLKESLLKITKNKKQPVELQFFGYLIKKSRRLVSKGINLILNKICEKHKYKHYLYLLNSIALRQMSDSEFEKRTILRDKKVKWILDKGIRDMIKRKKTILEEIKTKELQYIISTIQIEINSKNKYKITLNNKENMKLFSEEEMKIYSEIFNQMTEFYIFKNNMEKIISEHKWTNLKKTSKNLVKILLILTNLNNSLSIYYSQVIEHFMEKINEVTNGTKIEEIRKGHENKMKILKTYLFIPIEEDVEEFWMAKIKKVSKKIKNIFKISEELNSKEVSIDNFKDEIYEKVKRNYKEVIKTIDDSFIEYMTYYDKWTIFESDTNGLGGLMSEKEELHKIISTFKTLLSFNCNLI